MKQGVFANPLGFISYWRYFVVIKLSVSVWVRRSGWGRSGSNPTRRSGVACGKRGRRTSGL